MFKPTTALLIGSALAAPAPAQELWPLRGPFSFLDLQQVLSDAEKSAKAEAAANAYYERQFVTRVNRVAAAWEKMAQEYNQKRAINVKLAREVSEAFHALERSEGWPFKK